MSDREKSPFDEGYSESELIESAYQSVKDAKFSFTLDPVILVKHLHRDVAKKLYYNEPTQAMDFNKEVLPFLVFSSAVIEERSTELIVQSLIQTTHRDEPIVESEISSWTQGKREEWLFQLDIINKDLKDKLNVVRQTRNKLVHEPDNHDSLDDIEYKSNSLPDTVEKALTCVEELDSKSVNFDFSK